MKNLLLFALIMLSTFSWGNRERTNYPEILIQTKVDENWSQELSKRLRQYLKNLGLFDIFDYTFSGPIAIDNLVVGKMVPASSVKLLESLSKISSIDILQASPKVKIDGLNYKLDGLKVNVRDLAPEGASVKLNSHITASNLEISATRLNLKIVVNANGKDIELVDVAILNPTITVSNNDLIDFESEIRVYNDGENQKVHFVSSNFERVANKLIEDTNSVALKFSDFEIKASKIKIGKSKIIEVRPEEVEKLLNSNLDGIKGFLVGQVAKKLSSGINDLVNSLTDKFKLKNEYWIRGKYFTNQYLISKVKSSSDDRNLEVELESNFCRKGRHREVKNRCILENDANFIKSRITSQMHEESKHNIERMISRGDANVVVSISEDLITKALHTTYYAGVFNEMFKKAGVTLGTGKIRAIIEDTSDSIAIYIDLLHKTDGLENIIIPFSSLRFTVKLKAKVSVVKDNGISTAVVTVDDIDHSDKMIMFGRPDLGFVSNVHNVGIFEKLIVDTLKGKLKGFEGRELLRYPLSERLQNLGLEDAQFIGDGQGRINAFIDLDKLAN